MQARSAKTAKLRLAGPLQSASTLSVNARCVTQVKMLGRWQALLVAALLALAVGAAVHESFPGGRSQVAFAVRSHRFSQQGLLRLPLAARGPISAALGADSAAYRVRSFKGEFSASSPAQHLTASFSRTGVSVSSARTRLQISLRGVGYGTSLHALGDVAPRVSANRVLYSHADLSEWYSNGPLGLEQGFTIRRPPAGSATRMVTLSMAISGNLQASLATGGRSLILSRAGKTALRYTGLHATDARGHPLHCWLQLNRGRLLLRVDVSGSRYPLRIDPFIQQGAKLVPPEASGQRGLGESVALSNDGNTALIGGDYEAWVFVRSGSTWTEQAVLTDTAETEGAGVSVALSADGTTAIVGFPWVDEGRGQALVYVRTGATWLLQGTLVGDPSNPAFGAGLFGRSVAISADGGTALVGEPYDRELEGSASLFERTGSTWVPAGKITPAEALGEVGFGWDVAISGDAGTALIASRGTAPSGAPAVWTFKGSRSSLTQQGPSFSGGNGGEIGADPLALSRDGTTALVIGYSEGNRGGLVLTWSGGSWLKQALLPSDTDYSAALSAAGSTALLGDPYQDPVDHATVFARSDNVWSPGEGLSGERVTNFGASVALSGDGNTALIGAPSDHVPVGAAFVFVAARSEGEEESGGSGGGSGAPVNTVAPIISGTANVGDTLSCSPGSWTGEAPQTYAYTWVRNHTVVGGPSSQDAYVVTSADQGDGIQCEVTATNTSGTGVASSASVFVPAAPLPFAERAVQQVVFVHGIRADCNAVGRSGQSYGALYGALQAQRVAVYTFCYDHDIAYGDKGGPSPGRCFSASSRTLWPYGFTEPRNNITRAANWNGPLPVTRDINSPTVEPNDGDAALAYDAAKLDGCVRQLVRWDVAHLGHAVPIAIIGNSMGGAITRGWLTLAEWERRTRAAPPYSQALDGVTTVMFLQGAVKGSWLAGVGEGGAYPLGNALASLGEAQCKGASPGLVGCLDPNRAGIIDLAPGSAWYHALAMAPPHLHYYTYSTWFGIEIHVQFLLWGGTTTFGPDEVPGDGLMELGDGSYSSVPAGGGSGFLPFGFGPDQHWYIMKQTYDQSVQVGAPVWFDHATLYGLAAAGMVMNNPYSHLNFGNDIGALHIQSCDDAVGVVPVVGEITRVLGEPANACNSSDTGASAALTARQTVRFRSCTTCATTAASRPSAKAASASSTVPIQFIDHAGRARLALYTAGPFQGRFTLTLKRGRVFYGVLPARALRGVRAHLAATVSLTPAGNTTARSARAQLDGELDVRTRSANLGIRVSHPHVQTRLQTPRANTARARAAVRIVVRDLAANNLLGVTRLFNPAVLGGRSPAAIAHELSEQHVPITGVSTAGAGKVLLLSEGDPGWVQPVTVTARGRRPLHANLILQEEHGRWWLIGSS